VLSTTNPALEPEPHVLTVCFETRGERTYASRVAEDVDHITSILMRVKKGEFWI
jgi:hypothetical protein